MEEGAVKPEKQALTSGTRSADGKSWRARSRRLILSHGGLSAPYERNGEQLVVAAEERRKRAKAEKRWNRKRQTMEYEMKRRQKTGIGWSWKMPVTEAAQSDSLAAAHLAVVEERRRTDGHRRWSGIEYLSQRSRSAAR